MCTRPSAVSSRCFFRARNENKRRQKNELGFCWLLVRLVVFNSRCKSISPSGDLRHNHFASNSQRAKQQPHTHTSKRNKKSPFPFGSSMKMCHPIVKPGYDERDHKNNAPSKTMTMMESWRLLSTKNNFYNRNSAIHLSIKSACSYTTLTKSKKKKQKMMSFRNSVHGTNLDKSCQVLFILDMHRNTTPNNNNTKQQKSDVLPSFRDSLLVKLYSQMEKRRKFVTIEFHVFRGRQREAPEWQQIHG